MQALSGAALVYREELERTIHPELTVVTTDEQVSIQAMYDKVRAEYPDATVARAEFPDTPDQAVMFRVKQGGEQVFVAIDPYTADIVRDGTFVDWPLEWLFLLHDQLLAGPSGETLIGIEGAVLLFLVISGGVVWWPGRKRLRQGFRVRLSGSNDLRWRTLHRSVGAAAAIMLLISATTGVLLVWKEPFREAVARVTPADGKPSPKVEKRGDAAMVPLDDLVRTARASNAESLLRQIRFAEGGRVVAIYLDGHRTARADGTTQVYFNAYSGTEVAEYVSGTMPVASEFIDWLYTVHIGIWAGDVSRLMLFVSAIALAGLSITGPWLWYSRSAKRRDVRRRKAIAAGSAEA